MSSDSYSFRRNRRLIGGCGGDGCVVPSTFDGSSVDASRCLNDLCFLDGLRIAVVVAACAGFQHAIHTGVREFRRFLDCIAGGRLYPRDRLQRE